MAYNLEPASFQLNIPSANTKVGPLNLMLDRILASTPEGLQATWQGQMMVVVQADTPSAVKTLLVRRLREMADDVEHAEIKGP